MPFLAENQIYLGDAKELLKNVQPESVALSFWSPPYFLGKEYEKDATFESWQLLLCQVIQAHFPILKPGGFLVINIADILAFKNEKMPKIMGLNPANRKCPVTREMVCAARERYPHYSRYELAKVLNCSEQTIDRRLNGNNIRGGRYATGTHVKLVGGYLQEYAEESGLYLYDRRIWKKDPAWANSRWTTNTLKAVSETEDLYIFWKPGEYVVNRERLTAAEWKEWGYRQIWEIASVRANDIHPAMFPLELAIRVIRLYSDEGDLVLDPFLGSGTTALAAVQCRRSYLGFEKQENYYHLAEENLRAGNQEVRLHKTQGQLELLSTL